MERREFLEQSLRVAGAAIAGAKQPGLTGLVVRRGDSGYEAAREGYNGDVSLRPAAIVFCRDRQDVVNAVRFARKTHVPLRARSGRHSFEGFSSVDDGLVIDVSPMNSVSVNPAARTVQAGAGAKVMQFYEALWPHRLAVPCGSCATVGLAGLTLGGGYGLLSRLWGLTCDNLVGVEMVTASGAVVQADARRHADLFWACRGGGGGNFGIVTAFTFQTHPIEDVAIFRLAWDFAQMERVLPVWQTWATSTDDRLSSMLTLSRGIVAAVGLFVGPASELTALLQSLHAAAAPQADIARSMSYQDAVALFAGMKSEDSVWRLDWHKPRQPFKNSSDYANGPFGSDALGVVRRALEEAPSGGHLLQMDAYGGAISRVSPRETAFVHRGASLTTLQYESSWERPEDAAAGHAWVARFRAALRPFVTGGAYVNYCDQDITDWPQAYYGANLARLRRVKAAYDPDNVFQFPQGITLR